MKIINRNGPLEIITLVYDTALDRWTGEEWFGRLKKQRETLVLGHGTLLLGSSGFAGKEFWAAAEFRLRRPPPSPPRRWVTRMRHFGLQTPSISSSFHFVPLPLLSASSARGRWPPLLVQRSATYHIISFRLVGRVKLPHQAPARETSCRQRSTAYRAISTSSSSIHGGAAAHGETNLPARSQFHRTSTRGGAGTQRPVRRLQYRPTVVTGSRSVRAEFRPISSRPQKQHCSWAAPDGLRQ